MNLILSLIIPFATIALAVTVDPLPAPKHIHWGTEGPKPVSGGLWLDGPHHPILMGAFNRMQDTVRELKWKPIATPGPFPPFEPFPTDSSSNHAKRNEPLPMLISIKAIVNDTEADLQMGVDESYAIEIAPQSQEIKVSAQTIWGAVHAMTTLQQIIIANDGSNGGYIIEQPVSIQDAPDYPHRGIMIDIARNFQSKKAVKRQIDAMSLAKLNVVHLHLADTQSWPVQVPSLPDMIKGAYSPRKVYSTEDLREVIEYARARAIRVIPELDLPGHSSSGYAELPEADDILVCQNAWWSNDNWPLHVAVEPNPGQLNILENKTYEIVSKIYNDMSDVFTDHLFHIGMDELQTNCYNFSTTIMDYIAAGHDFHDLTSYWVEKALAMFKHNRSDRRFIMWEDSVLSKDMSASNVPQDVVMQSWMSAANVKQLAQMGYDVIISNSDWFYLDCGAGGWVSNDNRYNEMAAPEPQTIPSFNFQGNGGSWCGPYKSWQRLYTYDIGFNMTAEEKKHIMGIEMPLWAEQVDDTVIDAKLWPRAAAVAELTWSGNRDAEGSKRTTHFTQRILEFRERLVAMGVNAAPLMPEYCIRNPHKCDLNADQKIMDSYANNTVELS